MTDLKDFEKKGFHLVNGKLVKKQAYNKYRNTKTEVDDIKFDSKKESEYYGKLKLLKRSGEIIDFKRQVKMPITINDIHIANYILDFEVHYPDKSIEYIDIKGQDKKSGKFITTDIFKLKKKLVEAIYKIKIKMI
jgi:hypothetical protein